MAEACSAQEPAVAAAGERVAEASGLHDGGRIHVKVQERYLTILRRNGELHCIDSVCYHAGGPLGLGDIEEVNGRACLVCPWHYYKIDIASGDKYYQQLRMENGKMVPGDWVSNGVQQRTHKVWEDPADDGLYVQLSTEPAKLTSDQYASMPSCGDRVMHARPGQSTGGPNVGGDGKKPSGAVIKAAREASLHQDPGKFPQ